MSLSEIMMLTISEIVGDFALKKYANTGSKSSLFVGLFGYTGVIIFLIISLHGSTVLMVNGAWDGVSACIESLSAYLFLGERFNDLSQYIGLVCIVVGLFLLKIPLKKENPLTLYKLFGGK